MFGEYKSPELTLDPFGKIQQTLEQADNSKNILTNQNQQTSTGLIYEPTSPNSDSKYEFVSLDNFQTNTGKFDFSVLNIYFLDFFLFVYHFF